MIIRRENEFDWLIHHGYIVKSDSYAPIGLGVAAMVMALGVSIAECKLNPQRGWPRGYEAFAGLFSLIWADRLSERLIEQKKPFNLIHAYSYCFSELMR